eukprot:gene15154-16917_t
MSDEGSTPHGSKRASPNIPSNWAQKWSDEEDKRLLMGIEQYGENNWRMVAKIVGTRDAVKCMQRWEKGLKPGIIKGRWSEEEDRALVYLVSQGYKNWGQVAQHMPGRTSKQCRERWNHYLDPTLIHTPFTEEEDQLLLSLQSEHGNKWALIARNIPGRTENAVKLRHHALMKKTPSQQYVSNSSKDMGRLTSAENHLHSDINRLVFRENGDNGHVNHSNPNDTSNPEHARFLHNLHLMASEGMYRRDEERVDNNSMLQQQHQHQQRLYNTLRENNDNRHPMASFQHFQQQQLQQHYHVPPPFDLGYNTSSQVSLQQQASPDIHLNKRQRTELPPPLPLPDASTLPNTLQLQQLHYLSNNFPQLLHLQQQQQHPHQHQQQQQQQQQRQPQHQPGNNEAISWSMIAQPALQIEAETDFSTSQPHNEALLNITNYSLPFNEVHRHSVGDEVEIESD